ARLMAKLRAFPVGRLWNRPEFSSAKGPVCRMRGALPDSRWQGDGLGFVTYGSTAEPRRSCGGVTNRSDVRARPAAGHDLMGASPARIPLAGSHRFMPVEALADRVTHDLCIPQVNKRVRVRLCCARRPQSGGRGCPVPSTESLPA